MRIEENNPYRLRKLCEALGEEYKDHNPSRTYERLCKKYIIKKEKNWYYYIRPKTDEEILLERYKHRTYLDKFGSNIKLFEEGGVYKIQDGNNVYIGQTKNFSKRLYSHCFYETIHEGEERYEYPSLTKPMLDNGAKMEVLEVIEEDNRIFRLERELYWTQYYKDLGFNIVGNTTLLYNPKKHEKIKTKNIKVEKDKVEEVIKFLQKNDIFYTYTS